MNKEKFLSRINKNEKGCWMWLGAKIPSGYGQAVFNGRAQGAHRISYTIFKGDIPSGFVIDHLCRNPGCINPEHLEAVTQRQNVKRGVSHIAENMVKKTCIRGHLLAGKNLGISTKGSRICRKCKNEKQQYSRRLQGVKPRHFVEHKYIYRVKSGFRVEVKLSGIAKSGTRKTLTDAIELRQQLLKEVRKK